MSDEALRGHEAMLGPFSIRAGRLVQGVEMAMRDIARATGTVVEIDVSGGLLQRVFSVTFWGPERAVEDVEAYVTGLMAGTKLR